jgi:hypothetical protein
LTQIDGAQIGERGRADAGHVIGLIDIKKKSVGTVGVAFALGADENSCGATNAATAGMNRQKQARNGRDGA